MTLSRVYDMTPGLAETTIIHLQSAGRFYFYADKRWVTFNTNYGANYVNNPSSGGTAAEPNVRWNDNSFYVPEGATLRNFYMYGRVNTADVTDVEFFARVHDADFNADLAIDTAAEVGAITVVPATALLLDQGAGDMVDMRSKKINLGNHTMGPGGGILVPYMRAVGAPTATRFYIGSYILEYEVKL